MAVNLVGRARLALRNLDDPVHVRLVEDARHQSGGDEDSQ